MKDIEIYPSSWYYNACVQGFLEILAWGLGEDGIQIVEEKFLQDDGRVIIPGELTEAIFSSSDVPVPTGYNCVPAPKEMTEMKRIVWWWVGKGFEQGFIRQKDRQRKIETSLEMVETVTRNLLVGSRNRNYHSLVQAEHDKVAFLNDWFSLSYEKNDGVSCSFCGTKYVSDIKGRILDKFFTLSMSKWLGSSSSGFPNLFWNGKPNLMVCKTCRSFFLCFHLIHDKNFFINSSSFILNWHLNRLIAGNTVSKSYKHQTLLNALHYDPQLRRGLSNWGLQNMEVLIFDYVRNSAGKIEEIMNYYPLSPRLAKLFLIPRLSSLIAKISNKQVWDVILKERFGYLTVIIYKSLRAYISGKQNDDKDPDILDPWGKDYKGQPIVDLIDFYSELRRHSEREKGGTHMAFVNVKELRNLASTAPLSQKDSLVFRLLELTRLNRKADVYHLLLRLYVAKNITFPAQLSNLFTIQDSELFKIGIYAFISGLRPEEQPKED
jgi:CRISPR-associated protein Cst1